MISIVGMYQFIQPVVRLSASIIFFNLFLALLGLHHFAWAFSSCSKQGLLTIVVCGFLIAVDSLVAEHGL